MKRWLRDAQLQEKLGNCSAMTIWRLRRSGKLPQPRKINGRNFTEEDEADKAIAAIFDAEAADDAAA